ncbi:predicted protein [Methanosarcina acetivorans C2A]|uniref:Uncharacterized protein n=2 Tax=Methanosarcina acetivorans TaxID=2214 RepID=Q8TQ56_METAC|nr:predicted protein [Methanosarcina acetivorans C2A]
MYIKARCPVCGTDVYHDLYVHVQKYRRLGSQSHRYRITKMEIQDSQSENELVYNILQSLENTIHNGIKIEVLTGILKEDYGVTEPCCRDLIEKIKIELDMYCPDMETLYFV